MKQAIVVGCGLSGAVIARYMAEELNYHVTIYERRNHIAGNMYDYVDEHGILVHKYGPHTFHTKNKSLYDYMCRYGEWEEYHLTCGAVINQKYTPTPFNFQTIDDFYSPEDAEIIKSEIAKAFPNQSTATVLEMLNHKNKWISGYAKFLFDNDYSLYTAKQWGVSPSEIDPSVLKRVPLRFNYEEGYFDDLYQVMPKFSFVAFFENLLRHDNIVVRLNEDIFEHLEVKPDGLYFDGESYSKPVIYTGPVDELFHHKYGELPYRSLQFEWKFEEKKSFQNAPVVAYPQADGYTRITEYTKLPVQEVGEKTSYAVEYSLPYEAGKKNEPFYPVLTEESQQMYDNYKKEAEKYSNLYLSGRLADFKYYNMDQALERALEVCASLRDIND